MRISEREHVGPVISEGSNTGPKLRPNAAGPPCPDSWTPRAPGAPPSDVFPADCETLAMLESDGVRRIGSRNITMSFLADAISSYGSMAGEVDKPVVDKTGLEGRFDFNIEYTPGENDRFPRPGGPNADAPPPNPSGTSFLNVVRDQLGLKVVSSKGPLRLLVIDYVEKPSEN